MRPSGYSAAGPTSSGPDHAILFERLRVKRLMLANRIVMAPMTRMMAPDGVLGAANAEYYRKRVEAGVGLIISEGTWIPHPAASNRTAIPRFYGEDALAGWRTVIDAVHDAGGRIFPQLWHVGMARRATDEAFHPQVPALGPSGLAFETRDAAGVRLAEPMTQRDIDAVIDAFATAAASARELGCDGIEIHGAHGYLIDQFLWHVSNQRDDAYGGRDIAQRVRFACEVVAECRHRVGPDFPISFRFSQWKIHNYAARLVDSPEELERMLVPLVDAGVDVFHCSTRRYWEPGFSDSGLTLAGWTRLITDKPTIAVGSVGLSTSFEIPNRAQEHAQQAAASLQPAIAMLANGECDLVAVGRGLIANADWAQKMRDGDLESLQPYSQQLLKSLD